MRSRHSSGYKATPFNAGGCALDVGEEFNMIEEQQVEMAGA
jgi:hypothetical protein